MSDVLSLYASELDCGAILTDESSNFFRIWSFCILIGGAITIVFTMLSYLCQDYQQPTVEDAHGTAGESNLDDLKISSQSKKEHVNHLSIAPSVAVECSTSATQPLCGVDERIVATQPSLADELEAGQYDDMFMVAGGIAASTDLLPSDGNNDHANLISRSGTGRDDQPPVNSGKACDLDTPSQDAARSGAKVFETASSSKIFSDAYPYPAHNDQNNLISNSGTGRDDQPPVNSGNPCDLDTASQDVARSGAKLFETGSSSKVCSDASPRTAEDSENTLTNNVDSCGIHRSGVGTTSRPILEVCRSDGPEPTFSDISGSHSRGLAETFTPCALSKPVTKTHSKDSSMTITKGNIVVGFKFFDDLALVFTAPQQPQCDVAIEWKWTSRGSEISKYREKYGPDCNSPRTDASKRKEGGSGLKAGNNDLNLEADVQVDGPRACLQSDPVHTAPPPEPQRNNSKADAISSGKAEKTEHCFSAEGDSVDSTPNLATALEHLKNSSNTNADGSWRSVLHTSMAEFSEIGGLGLEFYFRLLRGLGICFAYMAVCTSPLAAFSWNGNFMPDTGSTVALSTIGNIGRVAPGNFSQESRYIILGCEGIKVKDFTAIFGYLDSLSVVFFMAYVLRFYFFTLPSQVKNHELSMRDFTVEINGLPRNIPEQSKYEELLGDHLLSRIETLREKRKHGSELAPAKICEVVLVRDFNKKLASIKNRAAIMRELDICSRYNGNARKVSALERQRDNLTQKLAKRDKPDSELPVLCAYVVLNCRTDVDNLLFSYRFANVWLLRLCQSRRKRFQRRAIRISRAPDPTNIIPENQDIPSYERIIRWSTIFVLWLIAMGASAIAIYYIVSNAKTFSQAANSQLGSETCDAGTHVSSGSYVCRFQTAAQWTNEQATTLGEDELNCFCQTKGHAEILRTAVLRDNICKSWLADASKNYAMMMAAGLVTIIINAAFRGIIVMLVNSERHSSVSAMNRSKMVKLFASQFINTALLVLLMNMGAFGVLQGAYDDFHRGWYAVVGGAMVTNLMFNSFVNCLVYSFFAWIQMIRRFCCRTRVKHHVELLSLYTNEPFDLSERYAQLLTTVFCTLGYSPGLPIISFFASLYCLLNYMNDKWLLLKASSRPPLYDATMTRMALQILFWAAPLHCAVAIIMFSNNCIFPSEPIQGALVGMSRSATSAYAIEHWLDRMLRESTWVLTLLLLVALLLAAILLALRVFGGSARQVCLIFRFCCCRCCRCRQAFAQTEATDFLANGRCSTFDQAQAVIETKAPPASYQLGRHPTFAKYQQYLRGDRGWNSHCASLQQECLLPVPSSQT